MNQGQCAKGDRCQYVHPGHKQLGQARSEWVTARSDTPSSEHVCKDVSECRITWLWGSIKGLHGLCNTAPLRGLPGSDCKRQPRRTASADWAGAGGPAPSCLSCIPMFCIVGLAAAQGCQGPAFTPLAITKTCLKCNVWILTYMLSMQPLQTAQKGQAPSGSTPTMQEWDKSMGSKASQHPAWPVPHGWAHAGGRAGGKLLQQQGTPTQAAQPARLTGPKSSAPG